MSELRDPDLNTAIYDFLCRFCLPEIDPEHIFRGYQNDMSLPDDNEYIIYTLLDSIAHGTGGRRYDAANEVYVVRGGVEYQFQVDCYSEDADTARQHAWSIQHSFKTELACEFLRSAGVQPLYADDAKNTTVENDSGIWIPRWTTVLHLHANEIYNFDVPGFTAVKVDRKRI